LTRILKKAKRKTDRKTDSMNANPSHKFPKGHKLSKGGVKGNKGGGRDSAKRKEVKRMVAEEVKAFIEKEVRPVLGIYKKIAMGVKRKRFNPKTGAAFLETEYDPATVRHWVDKFVPPIQRIELPIAAAGHWYP
jgi:hypothetical protein